MAFPLDSDLEMTVVNTSTDIPTVSPTTTPTDTPSLNPSTLPTAHHIFLNVNLTALGYDVDTLTKNEKVLQNGLQKSLVVDFVSIRKMTEIGWL